METVRGADEEPVFEASAEPIAFEVDAVDAASRCELEVEGWRSAELVVDSVGLVAAACLAALVSTLSSAHLAGGEVSGFLATLGRLAVGVPVLVALTGSSRSRTLLGRGFAGEVQVLALPVCAGGLWLLGLWDIFGNLGLGDPGLDSIFTTCVFGVSCVAVARVAYHRSPRSLSGRRRVERVVIVGSGELAQQVARQLEHVAGVEVIGFVDDDPMNSDACPGQLHHLAKICEREWAQHVVVAFSRSKPEDMVEALRPLHGRIPITVVPRLFEMLPSNAEVNEIGAGLSALCIRPASLRP